MVEVTGYDEKCREIYCKKEQSTRGDQNNASYNGMNILSPTDGEKNEGWNKMGEEDRSMAAG